MNHKNPWPDKFELCGFLLRDPNKDIFEDMKEHANQGILTNNPRIVAALRLLGYEPLGRTVVTGIERFCGA